MAEVSKTFSIVYDVKKSVEATGTIVYGVREIVSKSPLSIVYGVRIRVSKDPLSIVYGVRSRLYPAKVFSVLYSVRKRVSKSGSILYGVRVPIAAVGGAFSTAYSTAFDSAPGGGDGSKTFSIVYGVRSRVSKEFSIVYDTEITGTTQVSKEFSIVYHTLVTPGDAAEGGVITTPIKSGGVPPQIVTTSF